MGRLIVDVALNLLRLPFLPVWWLLRRVRMPRERWVHVKLRSRLVEVDRPLHTLARFVPGLATRRPTSLLALRELTDHILRDANVEGVVLEIPSLHAGWSSVDAVRELVQKLCAGGKKVVAWLPDGGGNRELFLASAATRVLTSPNATLSPLGIAASSSYVKGLLDRFGVQVEVHRRAEFKTAAETTVSETMSEAQREQLGALLDTIDRALVSALASRVKLGPTPEAREAKVRTLFDDALVSARAALDAGLIDGLCYEDGLPQALAEGEGKPPKVVRASRYFSFHRSRFFRPVGPRPYIAIVPVHGAITSGGGGPAVGGPPATQEAVIGAIRMVGRDPRCLGAVLHVNSPGGSAHASDLIHREVELLREKKPVIACFGEVAASGGYYIAAPAHAIIAQPLAITGSIGVVSARLVARDLLEGMGVHTEVVRRAPHADLLANPRPMDADEHAIFEREIDNFYRTFVGIVAKGRNKSDADVEPLARGRVWSGADAHARGLVDKLGGLDVAIDEVRSRITFLPSALRGIIEPRVVWPRPGDAPPIPLAAAGAMLGSPASTLLERLDPSVAEILSLVSGRERVLFYATGLPRID
ncbi:signal peptide peptidase SppA [Sandaracinus amylolyticus]|uniref:signal peptide peptidase SppA n=1 Tax=Sandaracinus amylolyticus TaxID=927083 RepID=UPI0012ED87C3|nr:signal peptide peptidase SppA [Sandaracinus amylolyticus]